MPPSLSEMVEYAKAKQPRNGLADVAEQFLVGASHGYEAGQKAKLAQYDQILKVAQANKAEQEARQQKMDNDYWEGEINKAKGLGVMPLTAGESMNGRVTMSKTLGEPESEGNSLLSKLAARFTPRGQKLKSVSMKLPFGATMTTEDINGSKEDQYAANRDARGDRAEERAIDKLVYDDALLATQGEDMMATEPSEKYLGMAARKHGQSPVKYISRMTKPPVNPDPWGLRTQPTQTVRLVSGIKK